MKNPTNTFEISQLSHELTNPITLIYSSLQRMEKEHPEIGTYAYWDGIMDEIHHMQHLLQDIKLFQSGPSCRPAPFSYPEFVQDAACAMQAYLQNKNQQLLLQCPKRLPTLFADKYKLRQVIENLIKNAAEASEPDSTIIWHIYSEDALLINEIIDHGQGITPGYEPILFEPFITSKPDGTGLGLSICRQIVEAHGGQLTYRKNPSRGTTFSFTLPYSINTKN